MGPPAPGPSEPAAAPRAAAEAAPGASSVPAASAGVAGGARVLLATLFVLSGAAALCYEVAWTRHLVLVFGNTTRAVALLLGAYMLGLALGSEAGGRMADRVRRPALLYAVFELAIAAFAFAFPWLVDAVRSVYLGLGTSGGPVLFVLAFALLVIPTFCMGTTLPLLVRATVSDPAQTGRQVGFLYAANIVGAVVGAAGTGFFLMERYGVLGVTWLAAGVNVAVGVVGFLAFRGRARPDVAGARTDAPAAAGPPSAATDHVADAARRAALVSAFASGFVGLAAQVVWTRFLTYFLNGFTWTFTAILATFLAGLALGGAVFGRAASASKDAARLLVRLHLAVAAATAATLWILGHGHALSRWAWDAAGSNETALWTRHRVMLALTSAAVLLVPAFLMGGCFPVATALYRRGLGDLGRRVGRLYAVNTAGCVLGSLVAGFVWQPLMGPSWSAASVAIVAFVLACAVAWAGSVRSHAAIAVSAAACVVAIVAADPSTPVLLRSYVFAGTAGREVELEESRHGQVCTVSVVRNTRERYRLLYTDEFQAAGTKPEYRYMRMLAHLPVALARDPSRTLVICFGTGTTAGSVATHTAVKTLDIVEISPEVLDVADAFRDVNKDVLHGAGRSDLDVREHVDDGRHFVLRSDETWGVISLEPLMPYTPAAIHFYTREFYETCRARLAPGGLVCQWIPLQGMSGDRTDDQGRVLEVGDFRRLVAAFVAVFPESAMFFVDGAVALIGGPDGVEMPWTRVAERLADPRVAADLREIGFADPARAFGAYVTSGELLRRFVEGVEPVTDERPVLEFHPLPPNAVLPWLGQNLQHMATLRSQWERIPVDLAGAGDSDAALQALYLAAKSGARLADAQLQIAVSDLLIAQQRTTEGLAARAAAREELANALSIDPGNESARRQLGHFEREWWTIQADAHLGARSPDAAAAESAALRALRHRGLRQDDLAWTRLAEARNLLGKFVPALEAACEATRLYPGGLEPRAERAFARAALGDLEGAAVDYRRALGDARVSALPDRLRLDAERALTAFPDARPDDGDAAPPARGKVPARLAVRIFAADRPDAFRRRFASELAPPAPDVDDAEALRRIAFLRDLGPQDAGDALAAWVTTARAAATPAAAEALVRVDAARAANVLAETTDPEARLALARAAGAAGSTVFVDPLLALLTDEDRALRVAARDSLFALVGATAPGLSTLDPADARDAAYRRAVADLRIWWVRRAQE